VHRDGPYVPSETRRSLLTLQLYLNDGSAFRGGRTRFYSDHTAATAWAALEPEAGSAIAFDHRAWHDGEAVTQGTKFVLRTDVLYERSPCVEPTADGRELLGRHRGYVWRAMVCADGSVVSAGRDGTVRRWPAEPGAGPGGVRLAAEVHQVEVGSVMSLAQARDGRLWCGTRSGRVGVVGERWAVSGSAAVLGLTAHLDGVAAATSAGEVMALDARGVPRWSLQVHDGWAWCVASDGCSVFSGGDDGRLLRTDASGRAVELLKLEHPLRALLVRSDGGLVAGDGAGWLQVVSAGGELLLRFRAHDAAITSLALAPDGLLATGSEDGRVRTWRAATPEAELTSTDFVTSVAFTADAALLWAGYEGGIWRSTLTRPSP
jgi:WD40 repeat protein